MTTLEEAKVLRTHCAEYSRAAGEDMVGTVKPADLWLLVEYRGRWEREVSSVFSPEVQLRLSALKNEFPKIHLALIRQPDRKSGPLKIFWAFAKKTPRLYQAEVDSYDELSFDTDIPREEVDPKLFGVCTHGTHDLCCAQFGNKIYAKLRSLNNQVWEMSHIGGCRFAPNVVCLPHGIVYGRVEESQCLSIIETYKNDEVLLERLRGRSCYSKSVQAAEQFVRAAKQLMGLGDLVLEEAAEIPHGEFNVTFRSRAAKRFHVSLAVRSSEVATYKSCSATELSPREKFVLTDLRESQAP